jgi:hypothetical protein
MQSLLASWLAFAPIWSIGLFTFGGMVAAALVGAALRRHRRRGTEGQKATEGGVDGDDGEQGTIASAVMGLLALLIAFTFAMAIDRFDTRRGNVLDEANAIGTTYLRAQLLEEPHRTRLSRILLSYTETRLVLASTPPSPEQTTLLAASDRLVVDLWRATVAAFPGMRPYPFSMSFLESMNALIDMDAARKAGRQARVPAAVFLILFLYQFVATGVIFYVAAGRAGRRTAGILFLLVGAIMVLIVDIDRPTGGGITESQEPMRQLREFMRAQPPRSFDRASPASARDEAASLRSRPHQSEGRP